MPSTTLSIPVSKVLVDLDDAEKEATEIIEGISDRQANWRPSEHSWSILQCLTHLSRTNRIYAAAMYVAVSSKKVTGSMDHSATVDRIDGPAICPGWLASRFIHAMEPPVRTRMKAAGKAKPATEMRDRREALAEFIESHKPVRGVIEGWSGLDLNAVRFKNPFIGVLRFTVGTGLRVVNAHDRRHLWQANQIRLAPGYPAK